MLEVRERPNGASRGPDEIGKDTMARQRAQGTQVGRPQSVVSARGNFLLASAVGNQTRLSQAETVDCSGRSHCAMTILCPTCEQPMKEYDRAFRCEPCREIIIFFTVSDTSPYITGACFRKRKSPSGAMRVPSNLPGPTPHVSRANPSANAGCQTAGEGASRSFAPRCANQPCSTNLKNSL